MGTAWASEAEYPWETWPYVGGIETVKVNIMLRIYSNQWHVYAGLAILNPMARIQIEQYAKSTTELFKLMLRHDDNALRSRIWAARNKVLGDGAPTIFLSETFLNQFSLRPPSTSDSPDSPGGGTRGIPNSHLSLLAMVDCWAALDIQPFHHLDLAATPIFRMWIGVAEYLTRDPDRLNATIDAALHDTSHRSNDLEFVVAARGWSQCVSFGNFDLYKERFMQTRNFFEPRFAEANVVGAAMLKAIMSSSTS
jgi:prephenate dehydrogenase (NADP+)